MVLNFNYFLEHYSHVLSMKSIKGVDDLMISARMYVLRELDLVNSLLAIEFISERQYF